MRMESGYVARVKSPVLTAFCDVFKLSAPELRDVSDAAERRRTLWAVEAALRAASDACERSALMGEAQTLWALPEVVDVETARAAHAATKGSSSLPVGWASAAALAGSLSRSDACVQAARFAARAILAAGTADRERASELVKDAVLDDTARAAPDEFRDTMATILIAVDLGQVADAVQYEAGSDYERSMLARGVSMLRDGHPVFGGVEATAAQRATALRHLRVRARMTGVALPRFG